MLDHLSSKIQIQRRCIETKANDGNHSHSSFAISPNILEELVVELSEQKTSPPLEIVLPRALKEREEA